MSLIASGLLLVAGATALAYADAVLASRASYRWRALLSGTLTCLVGLGGVLAGVGALAGASWSVMVPRLLPLSQAVLVVDPLSGLFMTLVGVVAIAAGIYSVGYPHPHGDEHEAAEGVGSRTAQAALPVFVAAMVAVLAAGNVTTFLVLWELMALASLVLVLLLAEHRARPEVGQAGVWYAGMTHAGLVAILLGPVVFANAAGTESFEWMRAASSGLSSTTRSLVFLLVFAGFGSKAGLVPLHVWLPRAHPEAPSYVSALISAAMVNLGLYGVLQAGVSTDLKRLLAYSTSENMGLIFIGVGTAGMFAASGNATLASLLMLAALLHTVNHAGFKTLLFLGAGAVLRSTGLRDLDKLGGLAHRMPATALLFGLGALGASGLPPGNGFVSE